MTCSQSRPDFSWRISRTGMLTLPVLRLGKPHWPDVHRWWPFCSSPRPSASRSSSQPHPSIQRQPLTLRSTNHLTVESRSGAVAGRTAAADRDSGIGARPPGKRPGGGARRALRRAIWERSTIASTQRRRPSAVSGDCEDREKSNRPDLTPQATDAVSTAVNR